MKNKVINWIEGISRGTLALLALLVLLGAANIIIRNLRIRTDLTQEQLYSLSQGSRNLLDELDQPVTLKLFFSASNAQIPSFLRNYSRQVEDLLTEYRIAAKGNVIIEKIDPKPDSDEEEWARKYGVAGQSLDMFGSPVYFGLVAAAGQTEAVIPVLDHRMQLMLEFNISRMIQQVTNPKQGVIGVISSLPVLGEAPPPFIMPGQPPSTPAPAWIAFQELKQDFELRAIENPSTGIPADLDLLLVVHPKNLSLSDVYAIDQYVLRGGRTVIFVDPMSVADQGSAGGASPYGMPQVSSDLPELFKAWGIGYQPSRILADFSAATPMRSPDGGVENNPTVVTYSAEAFDPDSIMTAGLGTLRAAFAGALTDNSSNDLQVKPLISTSPKSGHVSIWDARGGARAIRNGFTSSPDRQHLAMQIIGRFKTAFPEGRPPSNEEDNPQMQTEAHADAHLAEGDSVVIVIGDVDFLFDPVCVESMNFLGQTIHRPINDNIAFLANVIDTLGGGSHLIGIRSRRGFNRPFTRVDQLEAAAADRWREQESRLERSLQEARQQINQLQAGKDADQRYIISESQQEAIQQFQQREFEIRQQLRDVRRNLRRDIERLGIRVKAINITLMPFLVALGGIGYGVMRKRSSSSWK